MTESKTCDNYVNWTLPPPQLQVRIKSSLGPVKSS